MLAKMIFLLLSMIKRAKIFCFELLALNIMIVVMTSLPIQMVISS